MLFLFVIMGLYFIWFLFSPAPPPLLCFDYWAGPSEAAITCTNAPTEVTKGVKFPFDLGSVLIYKRISFSTKEIYFLTFPLTPPLFLNGADLSANISLSGFWWSVQRNSSLLQYSQQLGHVEFWSWFFSLRLESTIQGLAMWSLKHLFSSKGLEFTQHW